MVYSTKRLVVIVLFFSCVFSLFSNAITSLGEERANLSVCFFFLCVCSICACLVLSVSSSSWCPGRAAFVIVALLGLFSYLFYYIKVGFKRVKIILACFRDVPEKSRSHEAQSSLRTKR